MLYELKLKNETKENGSVRFYSSNVMTGNFLFVFTCFNFSILVSVFYFVNQICIYSLNCSTVYENQQNIVSDMQHLKASWDE